MKLKQYKPYTPSRRFMVGYDFSNITVTEPYKPLTCGFSKSSGRNNSGKVTSRFKGGGHKQLYRIIDWKGYDKDGISAKVQTIEYDPIRTSRIALLAYADGEKRYVLAWKGIEVGQKVSIGSLAGLESGNRKMLKDIPDGITIFNLEVTPNTKGKLIRAAGSFATIIGRDDALSIVYIKMGSGEVRKFNQKCYATIGSVSNEIHKNIVIGKAGRQRWLGRKPHILGKSMNPVDHPHGGGEGHTEIGLRYPKAFNGRVVAPGKKTRNKKKWSTRMIVSRRTKN